jgi:cytochrome c oxidase subunit 2
MPPPVGRLAPVVAFSLLAAVLSAPAWAGGNAGFGPVNPESAHTERVADAYWLIAALSVGILLLIGIPLALFVVRYRARGRPREADGPQVHGNTAFELAWTLVPVVIITAIAGFVFYKLPGITDPAGAGEPLTVRVEGRQFYWRYVYPNGAVAVDTMTVPAGRVVELEMTSPENDVIHSFWITALFGKRDTIPGGETSLRFVAERPGMFEGNCGELCGIQHAQMFAQAEVLPAAEFDRWLDERASEQAEGGEELGEALWEGVCLKCHALDEVYVGPALGENPTLADRRALEAIVRNGRGAMPAVGQGWTEREVDALYAYTQTLVEEGDGAAGEEEEANGG